MGVKNLASIGNQSARQTIDIMQTTAHLSIIIFLSFDSISSTNFRPS